MLSKDNIKWAVIAVLGGSGSMGVKTWIDALWGPYTIENAKKLEEERLTRHELERLNYNTLVIQNLLAGSDKMKLEKAIETTNEELHD